LIPGGGIVSEAEVGSKAWQSIPVGDDLGTLDYVLTEQMVADYRRVVDNPHAAYPTVAARHPANLFYRKYASIMRVPNMGHDSEYFNPPPPASASPYRGASRTSTSAAATPTSSSRRPPWTRTAG
jgi:hypothetical protein